MPSFLCARSVLAVAGLVWLAGCAAPKVAPPVVPPPVAPAPGAAAAAAVAPPAAAAGTQQGAASLYVWSDRMDAAAGKLRSALLGSGVEVSQTTDQRLWLSVPGEAAFAAGRSAVKPAVGALLDQVAATLRTIPQAEVQIVGNTDGSSTNTALALDRAASARDWMVARGVVPSRMSVSGRALRAPVAQARLDLLIGERGAPVKSR